MEKEEIFISWLSEFDYCPRRFWLKAIERIEGDNELTAEGSAAHQFVDSNKIEKRKEKIKVTGLRVRSAKNNLYGGLRGKSVGNILLRQKQYRLYDNSERRISTARNIVLGKAINSSTVLGYTAKDAKETDKLKINAAQEKINGLIAELKIANSIERIRGLEGTISQLYFGVFDCMIKSQDSSMVFEKRSRRPPENNTNAMLSLLYALLSLNCIAALETFGLDSYMGFLHELHPGRESLAMDLIEEFRAPLVDRFVLNLINRGQIKGDDFERTPNGVVMRKDSRKTLMELWEKEKEVNVSFPLYKKTVPKKVLPYLQAQLMSQFIRGDIEEYPPWSWRP